MKCNVKSNHRLHFSKTICLTSISVTADFMSLSRWLGFYNIKQLLPLEIMLALSFFFVNANHSHLKIEWLLLIYI